MVCFNNLISNNHFKQSSHLKKNAIPTIKLTNWDLNSFFYAYSQEQNSGLKKRHHEIQTEAQEDWKNLSFIEKMTIFTNMTTK